MSKTQHTEFACDNCGTRQVSEKDFPYEKDWIYIYNISGKKDIRRVHTEKDLHFCSKACFLNWASKSFMENSSGDDETKHPNPYKNGDSTYACAVFDEHNKCHVKDCGCECHEPDKKRLKELK